MQNKKLIFFSVIASLILLTSGFLYKNLKKIPLEEGPQIYPGILIGNPKANLTIKEYANLLCPACARFYNETYPQIESDYVLTGLVNFEIFLFPPFESAQAGICADRQGKFIAFSKLIYKKQNQIKITQDFIDLAVQAGLKKEDFTKCLEDQADLEKIKGWYNQGLADGVNGTPTFFINSSKGVIPGSYDFSIFKDLIEKGLNAK